MDGKNFDELARKLATGTSRRSVLRGFIGGGAALVGMKATETLAENAGRVTICHYTSSPTNPYQIISPNANSVELQRHLRHGDVYYNGCCIDSDCPPYAGQCGQAYCTAGTCDVRATPGATCDDGLFCTVGDVCGSVVGACSGTARDCDEDASTTCITYYCDEGADTCASTVNTGESCGDCLICASDGTCTADDPECDDDQCDGLLHNGRPCTFSTECCSGCCVNEGKSQVCAAPANHVCEGAGN